jgi:HAD superfamily phosphatase
MKPVLVFDMDGVLVDVTESYRETIARTVEHFADVQLAPEQIQDYKNQGGWNDDWKLSHHIIGKTGVTVDFDTVKEYFQELFLGDGTNGMILRERWVARPGMLEKLAERFQLAVFTGRPTADAQLTLNRFAAGLVFDPLVGMYDVAHPKPAPDGLLQISARCGGAPMFYVGDTVDDARAAKAAGVPFIGITAPENPRYVDLVFLFQAEGAHAIVDDINYLEEVFEQ